MNFPTLGGNWIDLIIVVAMFFYVMDKWRKGLIYGFIDVAGFLLSLLVALRLYPLASKIFISNFSLSRGISQALGFLTIAFLAEFIYSLLIFSFGRYVNRRFINSNIDVVLGIIPALLSGSILVAFLLTIMVTLPIRPDVKQAVVQSKIGGFLTKQTFGLERIVADVFGGAVEETLTFLTVKPQGNEVVNLNFTTTEYSVDEISEGKMLGLMNEARAKEDIWPLQVSVELRMVARSHCEDMFKRGYFSHYTPDGLSPFDRMEKAQISYQVAGENLAFAPNTEVAHGGLMNSPGHRKNILSTEFGKAGIGIIQAGIYGRMFCQEFTN